MAMTDDMIEDVFPEADSPQEIQWATDSLDEPTFPEGAWTNKTALVETTLEGQKYQVKFEGVYWTAIALPPGIQLIPGEMVAVVGREGTELVVEKQIDGPLDLAGPMETDPASAIISPFVQPPYHPI
jgi:hypothetical protein